MFQALSQHFSEIISITLITTQREGTYSPTRTKTVRGEQ